jgi:CHAT domain-containing protein
LLTARQRVRGESEERRQARVARAAAEYEAAAAGLSATLLGPTAALLGEKRLVIVADGALQYVPFAALPEPGDERSAGTGTATSAEPLVARHEIISLPSASVLAVLRREREGRKPAAGTVAVLADPVFDKDDDRVAAIAGARAKAKPAGAEAVETDEAGELRRATREAGLTEGLIPRLPFSRQEAEAILSLAPARSRMAALNFQANRRAATGAALSNYRIVHFATHGLLNAEHPELSGLVLSLVDEQGRAQDGFLRLHEIYNLSLPSAELVVLSACQTGLGKEVRGEGLVGLVRGFMYAGAPRVAASLWKVDDWATAEMMKHFYRGLLQEKLRPAEALRRAQAAMWRQRRWQSPYYWAGFVLQGDWK